MSRITRAELFRELVLSIAKRSTCTRKSVGAVIVKDGRVLSMGYNGSPSGMPHCIDEGCLLGPEGGCIRTQHAEANAIAWAAREGISLMGATLWVTDSPCLSCAKLIVNAGIVEVVYLQRYRDESGIRLLNDARIVCINTSGETIDL